MNGRQINPNLDKDNSPRSFPICFVDEKESLSDRTFKTTENFGLFCFEEIQKDICFLPSSRYKLAICFVFRGHVLIQQGESEREISGRTSLFLDPSVGLSMSFPEPSCVFIFFVAGEFLRFHTAYQPSQLWDTRLAFNKGLGTACSDVLRTLYKHFLSIHPLEFDSYCTGFLYFLSPWIAAHRRAAKGIEGGASKQDVLRQKVEEYLLNHLQDKNLSLTTIARTFNLSPRQLSKIFEVRGQGVMARLKELRLLKAAGRLKEHRFRNTPISNIAQDCGFGSFENFCRSFKEQFGMSATDWRNSKNDVPSSLTSKPE